MFWFEYRSEKDPSTTYVSSASGLTPAERAHAMTDPLFVREFQGDKFGTPYGRSPKIKSAAVAR